MPMYTSVTFIEQQASRLFARTVGQETRPTVAIVERVDDYARIEEVGHLPSRRRSSSSKRWESRERISRTQAAAPCANSGGFSDCQAPRFRAVPHAAGRF